MLRILVAALAATASGESNEEKMLDKYGKTPVDKVLGLIEKLQAETEQEGVDEAAGYDKYACFCKAQADVKLKNIDEAEAKITKLSARIKKLSSNIAQMNTNVADSNKEIKKLEKECEDEAKIRSDDHHEYTIKNNDILQAIDGTEGAIEMMEASKAASFLQMKPVASRVSDVLNMAIENNAFHPKSQKEVDMATSLLALNDEQDPAQAKMDASMGSKYHSQEIIESLMSILKDFKKQKNKLQSAEADQKHTFDMAQASRMNQLRSFEDQVDRTEEIIASKEEEKATCETDKKTTETDKESDETFLEELVKECEKTADAFDQRSKSRSNEMAALAEAYTILKGKVAATYGANKKLNLLSTSTGQDEVSKMANAEGHWVWMPEFMQITADSNLQGVDETTQKVVKYLTRKANSLQSASLSTLMLKARADHFVKVRTMIKDLIAKLEADAEAEQDQKGWCDEEMEKATDKRDENIGAMEGDIASISKTTGEIDTLTREIAKLETEIADLYNALNEATAMRKAEKAENSKTVEDATAGLNAVKAAIKVLEDFYGSFIQIKAAYKPPKGDADGNTVGDLAPDTGFGSDEEYGGNQDAASGILGLMAVIESDFEGTIKATKSAEKEASSEFDTFKGDTEGNLDEKKSLVDDKQGELKTAKADLVDYKDDLKNHGDLKKEALDELAKLKPACVGTGMDYAERVARREQEIESLKNAYLIFDDMALTQIKKH